MKVSTTHLEDDRHPDQIIQDKWIDWLNEEEYTYEGYLRFMDWREEILRDNPID